MSAADLERLRGLLFADPARQQHLVTIADEGAFIAALAELASAEGLEVDPDDVRAAMRAGDRRCIERWI